MQLPNLAAYHAGRPTQPTVLALASFSSTGVVIGPARSKRSRSSAPVVPDRGVLVQRVAVGALRELAVGVARVRGADVHAHAPKVALQVREQVLDHHAVDRHRLAPAPPPVRGGRQDEVPAHSTSPFLCKAG